MNSFSAIQSYNRDLFGWLSTTNMYTVNKQNYDSYSLSAFYAQLYIFLGDLESGKQFIDNFKQFADLLYPTLNDSLAVWSQLASYADAQSK